MSIKLGNTSIGSLYLGSTKIAQAYLGSTKIYESSPAPTPTGVVIGGKTYPTVVMPDGKEWLAVNLDYAYSGLSVPTSSASSVTSPQAMYYNYNESTYGWNGYKCGLLYNWYAVNYMETNKATLFPGWHVATANEWDALGTAINGVGGSNIAGTKLKTQDGTFGGNWPTGWNGTDDYGFSVSPGGVFYSSFKNVGSNAYFWTPTIVSDDPEYADYAFISTFGTGTGLILNVDRKRYQFYVRLVKDTASSSSSDDEYDVDWND